MIVIAGGGTGGHTSPGLAVAAALRARGVACAWIGSRSGLEARRAPEAGIPYHAIRTGKLRRALAWQNVPDVFVNAPVGVLQAWRLLRRLRPRVVFATGGFVALPVALAGALARVAVTFAESARLFGGTPTVVTGNPLRPELRSGSRAAALERFGFDPVLPLVYVTGGAQGSHAINRAVGEVLADLLTHTQCLHQSGDNQATGDRTWLQARRAALTPALAARYALRPWVGDELADVYAAAALVVSRAGAGTVNECCQLGVPALYVPLPSAAGDEQTANARLVERAGGCSILPQASMTPLLLLERIQTLLSDPARLKDMGERARALAVPDAADRIADLLLEIAA